MKGFLLKLLILFLCLINLNIKAQLVNMIADINANYHSYPAYLAILNNKLYFSADDGISGHELWVYDGINTPIMIADINIGSSSSSPRYLAVFNNKLYFSADDGISGHELWVYDGINTPIMIADMYPGSIGTNPSNLKEFNGQLYFSAAVTSTNGRELWTYDGINAPTIVADIHVGSGSSDPTELTVFNNQLYFNATDNSGNNELWTYDGINPPTVIEIYPGTNGSNPTDLTVFNNQLYFSAKESTMYGIELWTYDGINAPTMIADIYPGSIGSNPHELAVFNNQLYFNSDSSYVGEQLWTYDGVNAPIRVTYINSNASGGSTSPSNLTEFNGQLYFSATNGGDGNELWTYDGNNAPIMVADINVGWSSGIGSYPSYLTVLNNQLCFSANDGINGTELWALTLPVETGIDVHIECDSLRWIDNNLYTISNTTSATHFISGGATNGNDSLVILDLTILNPSSSIDIQSACNTYTWIDGNTYTTNNNTATFTLTNAAGCDSIITLNLTIENATTSTDIQLAPSPFTWLDGNTYTTNNNIATYTTTNVAGCDSIVTLDLTIIDTLIQGTITTSTSAPLQNSKVYLIQYVASTDSVFATDSTTTDATGFYQFTNTFQNAYVKAVPDVVVYPNEIPTYNISSPVFQNANAVYLSYPFGNTDFSTIAGINPGGNGFIGGIVGNGAGKQTAVGEPIPNLSLVLMNANNEVVEQTSTDGGGLFSFDDLEENTFSLWVDKAGILNNLAPAISLITEVEQDDLQFKLHETFLENITTVSIEELKNSDFEVYPNPTNGQLMIKNSATAFSVELLNILGESVYSISRSQNELTIDLTKNDLSKGTYLIKLTTKENSYLSKIVYE